MNLLVILYDPLGHVLNCQDEKTKLKSRKWHFFSKIADFFITSERQCPQKI